MHPQDPHSAVGRGRGTPGLMMRGCSGCSGCSDMGEASDNEIQILHESHLSFNYTIFSFSLKLWVVTGEIIWPPDIYTRVDVLSYPISCVNIICTIIPTVPARCEAQRVTFVFVKAGSGSRITMHGKRRNNVCSPVLSFVEVV